MDVESVSREVFDMLEHSQLGVVIAVWPDGGVTAHRQLGFRDRIAADGLREVPLTSFVRFSSLPSVYEIQERIQRARSHHRHRR